DAAYHAETLFFNGHGISKYLLSRAVRDAGYKVVFTGEGSDEILGGYAHFRRDMILHNIQDPVEAERLLKELEDSNAVSRGLLLPDGQSVPLGSVQRALGFVPSWFEVFGSAGAKRLTLLAEPFRAQYRDWDAARFFLNQFDVPGQLGGRDPLNQS